MPDFRKLTNEEVKEIIAQREKRISPSKRELLRQEYLAYMKQFAPGDWVEVELKDGDARQTVRNRLKRAARDLGYDLRFKRTRHKIRFEIAKRAEKSKAA